PTYSFYSNDFVSGNIGGESEDDRFYGENPSVNYSLFVLHYSLNRLFRYSLFTFHFSLNQ
ncbi:MAG TPA: hypothetical protein VFS31_16890, partial [Chitinophagaceae bacterium]|nr:hypothetical protein [Chitinophagaceae bacterium]